MLRASRADVTVLDDYDEGMDEAADTARGSRKDRVVIALAGIAACAILVNALFLQKGPHPAPIFSTQPAPAPVQPKPQSAAQPQMQAVPLPAAKPRVVGTEATGPVALPPPRPQEIADRSETGTAKGDAAPARSQPQARTKSAVPRHDPIAELLAGAPPAATPATIPATATAASSSQRIVAVQRALADFGYGQIKASGVVDTPTQDAIVRFERARKLPVTGQISQRLLRELSAVTGRPLE